MSGKLKNIVEELASEILDSALALRYDICTCPTCRNDMLAYILTRIPAKYVTTEQGTLHTIIQQARVEQQAEIVRVMLSAVDTISKTPRHKLKEDRNKTFQLLLDKIKEVRGLDFHHYHQELLKRRVALRLRANNIDTYWQYLMLLMNNPDEYDKLFEVLCINVSEFFRDPPVWTRMSSLLETLILRKKETGDYSIRIWSAGCANGEEPFSIAIILKNALLLSNTNSNFSVEIFATDVDKAGLHFATKATYVKESLKNVDQACLAKFFDCEGKLYRVKKEIKNMVTFQTQDLTSQDYIKDADIVVCRNVFIYFDRDLQEQLLMKFYNALKPGGYLIMGKAETLISEARQIFTEIDFESRIYMKA